MKPPYGDIDLGVIREVAKEARTLCYQQDRREAGSDLAKALHNCDRFLGLMAQEIERLRGELKESTEARQSLVLDNACWQAENRKLGKELAAAKAEPPRPAAIVYASEGVLHVFESYEEAVAFSDERNMDIGGVNQWIWHPKPT